jgi:hypothetical protein
MVQIRHITQEALMASQDRFVEIILKAGLEAAIVEIGKKREALRIRRNEILAELSSVDAEIKDLDEEPDRSIIEARKRAEPERRAYGILPYKDCIVAILRDNDGRMRSTALYRIAKQHGKQIDSAYVAVSKLIKSRKLIKEDLKGERGCILSLPR